MPAASAPSRRIGVEDQVQIEAQRQRHLLGHVLVVALNEDRGHDKLDGEDRHDQDQRGAGIDAAGHETLLDPGEGAHGRI
jgi:hypothetical protein